MCIHFVIRVCPYVWGVCVCVCVFVYNMTCNINIHMICIVEWRPLADTCFEIGQIQISELKM